MFVKRVDRKVGKDPLEYGSHLVSLFLSHGLSEKQKKLRNNTVRD